ncbi:ABC transporter substrate-binding protein [Halosimplex amylolyticum]|uniref:ABC transporter substrate-binding protein n=1 Tax=Halosimplex amylolyticum TaxID=3396616 RepID=UPI003F561F64
MPEDGNQKSHQSYSQTRRRFVEGAAALSAIGIAGCGSDGDGGGPTETDSNGDGGIEVTRQEGTPTATATPTDGSDETETSTPQGEIIDATPQFSGQLAQPPTDMQFNPFGQNFDSTSNLTAYEQVGHFDLKRFMESGRVSYIPRACTWEFPQSPEEGETVRISGNEDREWHNGDPVTADDVYTVYRLHGFQGAGFTNFVDMSSLERVDDKTVEMTLSKKANPSILKINLLGSAYGFRFNAKHSIYEDHLKRLEEAEGDEEAMNAAQEKLTAFELDEPVGTGWAKYKNRTPKKVVYEPYDGHPIGSEMGFETWTNNYASGQQAWQMALGGELDAVDGPPNNILSQLTKKEFSAFFHNFLSSQAIQFNQAQEHYGDPRVRRAFAWGINMDKAINPIRNSGSWGEARWVVEKPSGIMVNESAWLGDVQDSLSSYAPESRDKDKVVELMQDAGYERSVNGKWAKDGELFEVSIKHYGWPYIVSYMQGVKEDLQAMDFAVELSAPSTLTTDIVNGDYGVCSGFWGQGWHPFTSLDVMTPDAGWMATSPPETVSVPPVGQPDSSSTTEINVYQAYEDMMTSDSYSAAKEPVQKLAWVYNQTLPQIPVFDQQSLLGVDTEDFQFKNGIDEWDGKLLDGMFEMLKRGAFQVKRE